MKYRQLGRSELKVSEISFGCMSLEQDHHQNERLLRKAHEFGINFFDTADLYDKGWNEESVGKALKPIRDQVIIATKVGNEWRDDGSGWDWNPRKEYLLKAVEDSLIRLQTDYIDLYQLHGGTIDDPTHEAIEAFEELKKEGKIREYGISSIRPNVIRRWIADSNMTSVMMQYSIADQRPEEFCLNALLDAGVSVITRGSLAKGLLINKEPREYLDYTASEMAQLQQAANGTSDPIAVSLQYVLQHPAVASAVTGIRTMEQLEEIQQATKVTIAESELNKLGKLLPTLTYTNHR